jgi:hypothetical protein
MKTLINIRLIVSFIAYSSISVSLQQPVIVRATQAVCFTVFVMCVSFDVIPEIEPFPIWNARTASAQKKTNQNRAKPTGNR